MQDIFCRSSAHGKIIFHSSHIEKMMSSALALSRALMNQSAKRLSLAHFSVSVARD
jgi:hypothetical protein